MEFYTYSTKDFPYLIAEYKFWKQKKILLLWKNSKRRSTLPLFLKLDIVPQSKDPNIDGALVCSMSSIRNGPQALLKESERTQLIL